VETFSHCLSVVRLWPSSSKSTGCVAPLKEIELFSVMLAQDGLAECDQPGKNPLKYSATVWELNPDHGEDRQWAISLSYHNPGHGEDRQWDTCVLPLSYHNPGHGEDRQWDTFVLPLSYYNPGHGEDRQWDTFVLPLSYHDQVADVCCDLIGGLVVKLPGSILVFHQL